MKNLADFDYGWNTGYDAGLIGDDKEQDRLYREARDELKTRKLLDNHIVEKELAPTHNMSEKETMVQYIKIVEAFLLLAFTIANTVILYSIYLKL